MSRHTTPVQQGHMQVFIDGQNLYKSAKRAFGYNIPNFDVMSLAHGLAEQNNCKLGGVHFYTGMPGKTEDLKWHNFWARKLVDMGRVGVNIFNPPLRYQNQIETMPDGSERSTMMAREKGVDVRIAIDMVRHACLNTCDTMMLVSRDNDLAEAVKEARMIASSSRRRLEVLSAYPVSRECDHKGVRDTRWVPMTAEFYNAHLDHRNYFVQDNETSNRHLAQNDQGGQRFHPQTDAPIEINNPLVARAQRAAEFVQQNDNASFGPSGREKQDFQRPRPRL